MVILERECFIVTNLRGQNIWLQEVLVLVCIGQCSFFFFKPLLMLLSHVHLSLLLISEESSSEEDSSEDEKPAVKGK